MKVYNVHTVPILLYMGVNLEPCKPGICDRYTSSADEMSIRQVAGIARMDGPGLQ